MNAMQLGFALREKTIGVAVIEEVLSDLTLAKWASREEMHIAAADVPRAANPYGGFRVGGQSMPRPAPPRSSFADPDDVDPLRFLREQANPHNLYPQPSPETYPQPSLDDVDPLRPLEDSGLRRALLDAAVRRRRSAELRLLGLQREEINAPAASSALYPYKFAMGCIPNPAGAEPSGPPDDEPFRNPADRSADTPTRFEGARQDERGKKTG
jgi:hypothetical protein